MRRMTLLNTIFGIPAKTSFKLIHTNYTPYNSPCQWTK